jgi:hypothetical protein
LIGIHANSENRKARPNEAPHKLIQALEDMIAKRLLEHFEYALIS